MFRPAFKKLLSFVSGHRPQRKLEIATVTLPRDIAGTGPVRMRKVGAHNLDTIEPEAGRERIGEDIDIWIVPAPAIADVLASRTGLSAEELARAETIAHIPRRVRFLAMRAVLRTALSHYVQGRTVREAWRFADNGKGKPELVADMADLSFSITHAEEFSVLAVTSGSVIGIDAEKIQGSGLKFLPLHCLSKNEAFRLQVRSEQERYEDFFRLWTLKEAYVKALGLGVSVDFSTIDFCAETAELHESLAPGDTSQKPLFGILKLEYVRERYLLSICMIGACISKLVSARKSFFILEERPTLYLGAAGQ